MEYDSHTYFTEHEEDSVKGFTILKAQNDQYHIAEKWMREGKEDTWIQYWIPEAQLLRRVSDGNCEPKAKLTDEQYAQVCGIIGFYEEEAEAALA